MLNDEELLRYSRQILLKYVDIAGQLRLKNSKVLIVGLGGLGSPVALYLAAAGVGELYLADFDRLDLSNLQRQIVHDSAAIGALKVQSAQARLQALNPQIAVHTISDKLNAQNLPALVQAVDLVLDCSDNFTIRGQLNAACFANNTVLVSGAAIRTDGQVSVYDPRNADSPCYHCVFGEGEEEGLTCSEAGVLGPLVGLVGSLQALEAMKILAGFGEPLIGRLLLIDALSSRFRELKLRRDPNCPVCGERHA
ncbi:MAG: molybdopterin-synthase adenylyltransferase MoeB [Pseudomonas sp.]|jgi:adenylyltransferase/sulfurtransferase|nr:molybdopterin-synthase adenylyltransferase MoeB [Pseudomonas sp.]